MSGGGVMVKKVLLLALEAVVAAHVMGCLSAAVVELGGAAVFVGEDVHGMLELLLLLLGKSQEQNPGARITDARDGLLPF